MEDNDFDQHYFDLLSVTTQTILFPKHFTRPVAPEVPSAYSKDYQEACAVLPISSKASAALSRRIVQAVIRERYQIVRPNLAQEIEAFIRLPEIPSFLAQAVDAIRQVGNFAAHPLKDSQTGSIIEVEDGEAEWLLEVIASLFDVAYVQPMRLATRREALNSRLAALGRPPMKG